MAWESVPGNSAGQMNGDGSRKLLLHSTEGFTVEGALGAYRQNNSWPTLTVDCPRRRVVRHLADTVAARSLRNRSGGVETNRDGTILIQIELMGFAGSPETIGDRDDLVWLGTEVVGPLCKRNSIPIASSVRWAPYPSSYGLNATQRLSPAAWDGYSGVLGHQHAPENCVSADTLVLTADLRWVPAGSLVPGDEIVGFDEESRGIGSTQGRRFCTTVVESNHLFEADAWHVATPQGVITTTGDHPWLVSLPYVNRGVRTGWVHSRDLDIDRHQLYMVGRPWQTDGSHDAGYLAGLLDADGHVNSEGAIGFGQVPGEVLDWFLRRMADEDIRIVERAPRPGGFGSAPKFVDVWVKGGFWHAAEIVGSIRPRRLLTRMMTLIDGRVVGKTAAKVPILGVRQDGRAVMAGLQTSTRTFVADGLLVHNTHGDPGAIDIETILSAARGEDDVALTDPEHQVLYSLNNQVVNAVLPKLNALAAAVAKVEVGDDLDEAQIAQLVLAGLSAEAIADALDDGIAAEVADLLSVRLGS